MGKILVSSFLMFVLKTLVLGSSEVKTCSFYIGYKTSIT